MALHPRDEYDGLGSVIDDQSDTAAQIRAAITPLVHCLWAIVIGRLHPLRCLMSVDSHDEEYSMTM